MASFMDFFVSSTSFCCFVTAGDFTDGGETKPGDFRDVRGLRQGAGEDAVSTDLIGAGDVVESTERLTLVGTGATLSSSLDVAEKPVGRPDDGVRRQSYIDVEVLPRQGTDLQHVQLLGLV